MLSTDQVFQLWSIFDNPMQIETGTYREVSITDSVSYWLLCGEEYWKGRQKYAFNRILFPIKFSLHPLLAESVFLTLFSEPSFSILSNSSLPNL
jgi:hypothetical protein